MRSSPYPRLHLALLCLCSISLATALISLCLAFTVNSPSRNLRPVISNVDSMYTPVYVSMTAAGLLIMAAVVAMVSVRHGNRVLDTAGCAGLLAVSVLALVSLGLVMSVKASTESSLEGTLAASLKAYGPGNVSIYQAWDDMQATLACCAVRTNLALDGYQVTPWYLQIRQGNPYGAPRIPDSCCSQQARANPSQLSDCTINLPTLPAQNPYMNQIGCFDAVRQMTETFTVRYIIVSLILLMASGATFGAATGHLVLLTRTQPAGGAKRPSGKSPAPSGFDNPAVSLSRASLASASAVSAARPGRSPAQSVYGGSQRSATASSRLHPQHPQHPQHPPPPLSSSSAVATSSLGSLASLAKPAAPAASPAPSAAPAAAPAPTPLQPTPLALKAQPIRSSGRGRPARGAPQSAANQRATVPGGAVKHLQSTQHSPPHPQSSQHPQPHPQSSQNPPPHPQSPQHPPPHPQPQRQQQTLLTPNGKRESTF